MAQITEPSDLTAETNGEARHGNGMLVPREHDYAAYAMGAPMAPIWQEQSTSNVSLTKIMHSFRRRWMLALFVGLFMGGTAALATWLLFPRQFEVEAILQFENVEDYLGGDKYVNPENVKKYRETQLYLVSSDWLLQAALRDPKVANLGLLQGEDEPMYFLRKSLNVFSPRDSNLMIIRMKEEEPRDMVAIVRAITQKYLENAVAEARTKRLDKIAVLNSRHAANEEQLRDLRAKKLELSKKLGVGDDLNEMKREQTRLLTEIQHTRNGMHTLSQRHMNAEEELERLKAKVEALKEGRIPEALLRDEIHKNPRMIKLQEEIAAFMKEYKYTASVAKNARSNPTVAGKERQLAAMREEAEELYTELRESALARFMYGEERPEETVPVLEKRVERLSEMMRKDEALLQATNEKLAALSKDSAEVEALKTSVEDIRKSNEEISKKLDLARLDLAAPPPVRTIQEADMPEGSTLMYRIILTSFLGLMCLSVGVGAVVLIEYTKHRVSSLNEIGYGGLGLRVLGTVPNLARLTRVGKNGDNGSVSGILAESIDSVRTMLLSNKRTDAPKVIMVTSADEHEGKTTVATHLAASLARAGRRTLLVDGDLRKPSIHLLFDMPLGMGLCEVLRGEAEIDAVIHPAQVEGMWVMLAGLCDQRALASLAKENAEAFFRTIRADYDFVIVDSGPALAFADTMLMGSHADAAVLAILRDVSQIPKVYEARERLEAIGVEVLGGVVGGVSPNGNRAYALLN